MTNTDLNKKADGQKEVFGRIMGQQVGNKIL